MQKEKPEREPGNWGSEPMGRRNGAGGRQHASCSPTGILLPFGVWVRSTARGPALMGSCLYSLQPSPQGPRAKPAGRFGTKAWKSQVCSCSRGAVWVSPSKVCVSRQPQVAAKKAIAFSDYINRGLVSGSMRLRVPLHSALVKLYLKPKHQKGPVWLRYFPGGSSNLCLKSLHWLLGDSTPLP